MQLHFALDFDGTISPIDTTDLLLEAFADPSWRDVEEEWRSGRIGSRECLSRQVALLRARPEELREVLSTVRLDKDFTRFVTAAWMRGASLSIVSDGFDLAIVHLLHAHGIDLPVTANRLVPMGGDRWRAVFSNTGEGCASGTCKCAAAPRHRQLVLVGDGRSDFCLAQRADHVLAKGDLAKFCAAEGISHTPIAGFADALCFLDPPFVRASATDLADRFSCEDLHA